MTPPATLKSKTITSILWSVLRTGWATIISFLVFAFLARLLEPTDFGRFALASLVFEVAKIVGNAGLPDAVMREQTLDNATADSVFWAGLGWNFTIACLLFVLAPLYEQATQTPGVAELIRWLCFMLPVIALGTIHNARLAREFGHQRLALQVFVVNSIAGAVAMTSAYKGLGAYSLVLQTVCTGVLGSAMSWYLYRWIPRFSFDYQRLKKCAQFGVSMMTTQLLWLLTARLQEPFIGRFYGTAAVGQYRISWRLIELIGQTVLAPIGSVAMITLSNLQNDTAKFASAFKRLVIGATLISLPLLFGFGAFAIEVVGLVFGPQWKSAGPIAEILVLMAVPFAVNYIAGPALAAIGRPGMVMSVSFLQLVLTLLFTYLATPFGLKGIAGAYVLRAYITTPVLLAALQNTLAPNKIRLWRELMPLIIYSAVVFFTIWLIKPLIRPLFSSDILLVGFLGVASLIIYISGFVLVGKKLIEPYIEIIKKLLQKKFKKA